MFVIHLDVSIAQGHLLLSGIFLLEIILIPHYRIYSKQWVNKCLLWGYCAWIFNKTKFNILISS